MSTDFIIVAATPYSLIAYSCIGTALLIMLYGFYGLLLTFLQYVRYGPKRFSHQTARPVPPSGAMDPLYGTHEIMKLKSSGLSMHLVSKGLPTQPMILFVHGFPECWYSWRRQMKYFSKEYRVVAIDQRGYGLTSKAPYVMDYRVEILASDVADVIEQLGYQSCILVGHGTGGFVAWVTAMLYPHLVDKLIVMNCPHPIAFRQELSLSQIRRSCQLQLFPELNFEADDFASLTKYYRGKSFGLVKRENMTDEDIEVFKYTFSQEGTTKAAINFFRAFIRYPTDFSRTEIMAPVLVLWGRKDSFFGEEYADGSKKYCNDIRIQKIPDASHWINQDSPDLVNKYMDDFLHESAETAFDIPH